MIQHYYATNLLTLNNCMKYLKLVFCSRRLAIVMMYDGKIRAKDTVNSDDYLRIFSVFGMV